MSSLAWLGVGTMMGRSSQAFSILSDSLRRTEANLDHEKTHFLCHDSGMDPRFSSAKSAYPGWILGVGDGWWSLLYLAKRPEAAFDFRLAHGVVNGAHALVFRVGRRLANPAHVQVFDRRVVRS